MENSRPLKFRAWDVEDEVMLYGESIAWVTLGTLAEKHDNHFMQYTGLKDKNGKEIYEGDIVKIHNKSELYEIFWYNGLYWVGNDETFRKPINTARATFGLFEVIGNIYENEGLLK